MGEGQHWRRKAGRGVDMEALWGEDSRGQARAVGESTVRAGQSSQTAAWHTDRDGGAGTGDVGPGEQGWKLYRGRRGRCVAPGWLDTVWGLGDQLHVGD